MADSEYIILQGLPTPQVYHDLRKEANLTPPPLPDVPKALANSVACFVAYERKQMINDATPSPDQSPVAMGRLVGDASLFMQIVDIAVHPGHQRKGLGKRIMQTLVDYVDEHAPNAYVSLVAEPLAQKFYLSYGFEDVKPSMGMYRCMWIKNNPEYQELRRRKAAALAQGLSSSS